MRISLRNIKEPWSFENIRDAYSNAFAETNEIIEKTEGGLLWNELKSLNESVWVLDSCTSDLLDEISKFAHQTTIHGFWDRINRPQEELYSRRVKKLIFCTTSSAMALVEHARRFNLKYSCPEFDEERMKRFGDSGIHEFIQKLRNYTSHWRMAEANWEINLDFIKNSRHVKFILKRNELLNWDGWSPQAHKYIDFCGDKIDVYEVFNEYNGIANTFYQWHKSKVFETWSGILKIYFQYKIYLNQVRERIRWNIIVSNIPKDKDPYEYLNKYLTDDQIEDVFSYEYKTVQQIDRLIELIDLYGACDRELRAKIYDRILNKK
jgi:hypothetical protein